MLKELNNYPGPGKYENKNQVGGGTGLKFGFGSSQRLPKREDG